MKRQEINFIKAFISLNENISKKQQELYDTLDHLKLSHNRKTKALHTIQTMLENYAMLDIDKPFQQKLLKLCKDALFSNGRIIAKHNRSIKCNGQ